MEKISALIEKLQELKNSGADLQTISYYVQLLQAEVLHARSRQHQQEAAVRQSQIAVIMPARQPAEEIKPAAPAAQTTTLPSNKPVLTETDIPKAPPPPPPAPAPIAVPVQEAPAPAPVQAPPPPPKEKEKVPAPAPATLFDVAETPAAPKNGHSGAITRELNELVGNNGQSLNDRLRTQQQVEVAQKLGDAPIKDLRQAIGINDKYQFIQELFRGDKDLYERSIKTINECHTMQEADYWIQREIKILQGWQDEHHLVKHFYSLLRKRFS
ncbi:hypothetical protein [Chitinophaga vietnamensis]|uniref:hypothetical protein n=1 Tax=Chitinophaga vietnamensis TaxID=2593957 RepID=UPI00117817B6|nr:hypothetical protein [Chitinophaga vietnamensis]